MGLVWSQASDISQRFCSVTCSVICSSTLQKSSPPCGLCKQCGFPRASGCFHEFLFCFVVAVVVVLRFFFSFFLLFVDKEVYQFVPFLPHLKRLRTIRDGEILLSERFCQLAEMSKKTQKDKKLFRQDEKKKLGGAVSQIGTAGQR